MNELLILGLSTLGALFILLAAIGFVKMPDIYLRISVTTKAVTLGIGLMLASAAVHFGTESIVSRVLAIVFFVFLTSPVGAHLIGRVSYFTGIPLWKNSLHDDLKGKYNPTTHKLSSSETTDESDR
ncbi:monovalent cation/H(+) antiporter subunit G [Schleiferia thermophila]|uniref:Multisubunit sodium/proton antiporter MrpG subunit n=1 Tax=Schleiferia thermophila TaxID=884107 RepID=A0A368ZZG8_9FLAO|nr:monovalent cation/H(+) antiporter subunit G [Schleiferia thermophila]RCX01207.1 multisubunit sodium/proton antiporter MrpG subunit [Schleiferia thermophila]GCD80534.1 Na+/H+ antiporter subunit G [Schleiferia thermophila]